MAKAKIFKDEKEAEQAGFITDKMISRAEKERNLEFFSFLRKKSKERGFKVYTDKHKTLLIQFKDNTGYVGFLDVIYTQKALSKMKY